MKTYPADDRSAGFVSLARGEDLLDGLHRAVAELGFHAATLQVIGALEAANLGYFDPERGEYRTISTGHVEISAGLGNVSLRDGKPFVHLHLVVSEQDGTSLGGHAMEGCRGYVVEAYLRKLDGPPPVRQEAPGMTLKVWPSE
jgi:predicted DNA-binding protein with PD1-like motif